MGTGHIGRGRTIVVVVAAIVPVVGRGPRPIGEVRRELGNRRQARYDLSLRLGVIVVRRQRPTRLDQQPAGQRRAPTGLSEVLQFFLVEKTGLRSVANRVRWEL